MPRLQEAMKDVIWLRKDSARCQVTFDPDMSEWGNPPVIGRNLTYVRCVPREVKHLSTWRNRKQYTELPF